MNQTKEKLSIHRSQWGTYHPNPNVEIAWTVNDTRGYMDAGPSCDNKECENPCECWECGYVQGTDNPDYCQSTEHKACQCDIEENECIGLSFAYVCLNGGESYCETCVDKLFDLEVIDCDCL